MPHLFAELDFVVSAFIVHPRKPAVALVDHKKLGCWLPPGGHVELGEDTDKALKREIEEETGLQHLADYEVYQTAEQKRVSELLRNAAVDNGSHETRILYTPYAVDMHAFPPLPGHKHLAFVYVAFSRNEELKLEGDAHKALKWVTIDDTRDKDFKILPTVHQYMIEAIHLRWHI